MFIKTTFNSDLNHILNCVNKCDFGTKCFAKVEHFVLRLIISHNRDDRSFFDMYLMAHAKNMILANSTFSCWAAYLNRTAKIIITPDRWVNTDFSKLEALPNEWIKIRV